MTLTATDLIGILVAIGGLAGLFTGIANMKQIKALNAKLIAEAGKTKAETGKIEQEKTTEGMNSVVGGAQAVIGTGTTLLTGLVARIDSLESQLKEEELINSKAKEELTRVTKAYQLKISKMMRAIQRNIAKRNLLAERNKCPRDCVAVDARLQEELADILAEEITPDQNAEESEKEIKNV